MNAAGRVLIGSELECGPDDKVMVRVRDGVEIPVVRSEKRTGCVVLEIDSDDELQQALFALQEIADSGRSAAARKASEFLESI